MKSDPVLQQTPEAVKLTSPPDDVVIYRPIHTAYYRGNKLLRVNQALWANNAVLNCVKHLQLNDYGATRADIYDAVSGVLHAVITHNVVGKISIVYKREVKEGM